MAKLGDYADFIMGQAPASSECNTDGRGTPFVKAGQFGISTPVVVEWTTNPLKMADDTDVLICVVGATSGKLNRGIKCAIGRSVAAIRPHENVVRDYIYYGLHPWIQRLRGGSQGSAIGVITKDMLDSVDMVFPTTAKQEEIVQTLSSLEGIIEKRKQEIEKMDQLIKARFVELFEDGESPLKTIEELCSDIVDCPHTTPKYEGDLKNPAIRTSEIKKGYITWNSMKYVSDEEYEERVSRLRPEAGDIVYGREGTFGNAAVLPEGYKFCLGQRVMLLRPDYTKCTSEYLLHAVISDDVYRQAVGKNNASTVAHVNVKDVKQFKVPLPSFDKQNQFADFVKQVDKSKVAVQKALNEAQLLFDSLMQEYFG